jgi:hypothetical protein
MTNVVPIQKSAKATELKLTVEMSPETAALVGRFLP